VEFEALKRDKPPLRMDEKALREELSTAVEADERRRAVDEMKKRSVLTARSYDEFKNLVACAEHGQRPVTSREMEFFGNPGRYQGFHDRRRMKSAQTSNDTKGSSETARMLAAKLASPCTEFENRKPDEHSAWKEEELAVPKTMPEFEQFWRREDLEMQIKAAILVQIDTTKVFRVDSPDLGEIIQCLKAGVDARTPATRPEFLFNVQKFLSKLPATPRFELNLSFLSKRQQDELEQLLADSACELKEMYSL